MGIWRITITGRWMHAPRRTVRRDIDVRAERYHEATDAARRCAFVQGICDVQIVTVVRLRDVPERDTWFV